MCSQPHINYLYINLYIHLYIFKYIYIYIYISFSSPQRVSSLIDNTPFHISFVYLFSLYLSLPLLFGTQSALRKKPSERKQTKDWIQGDRASFKPSVRSTTLSSHPCLYVVPPQHIPSCILRLFSLRFRFLPNVASSRIRCTQRRHPFRRQTLVSRRCRYLFSEDSCLVNKSGARSTNLRPSCPFTTVMSVVFLNLFF